MDLNNEWENFLKFGIQKEDKNELVNKVEIPKPSELHISTITKIIYLSNSININEVFWKIKVMNYDMISNGVIKKQLKVCSTSLEDYNDLREKIDKEERLVYENVIINGIENNHVQFKDVRKISVGLSKKDLQAKKIKQKSAFYNCFVICLRVCIDDYYHELHIKVFNTGKLEIPGIKMNSHIGVIMSAFLEVLRGIGYNYDYSSNDDTVLINSNFHCGYYVNREKLHRILKYKYNINNGYDPCSYPGIQCKYYYYPDLEVQDGKMRKENENMYKVSFMIFRTGSILIVGKVTECVLYKIYENIKKIMMDECNEIFVKKYERKEKSIRKNKMIEIML